MDSPQQVTSTPTKTVARVLACLPLLLLPLLLLLAVLLPWLLLLLAGPAMIITPGSLYPWLCLAHLLLRLPLPLNQATPQAACPRYACAVPYAWPRSLQDQKDAYARPGCACVLLETE